MLDDIKAPDPPKTDPVPETEQKFETPEAVASREDSDDEDFIDLGAEDGTDETPELQPDAKPKRKWWPPTKKQWIIYGVVLAVILGGGGAFAYSALQHKPTVAKVTVPKVVVKKTSDLVPSTLSGLPVSPSANQRPITAVMVENLDAARPQAGLSQAGVVFEALVEGGITRFMALYQDQVPTNVGPVRSVRPYFLDWSLGFDAPIAHAGGSPDALSEIPTLGVKNLDYLYYPAYYTRISSRPAPHNLYTSIPKLISLEQSKGWTSSDFSGWPRKPDAPAKTPNATAIKFTLSYADFNVAYSYDASTNSYNRSEGGAPQIDANSGKQLSPKVVIGMIVPWSQGSLDTSDAYYSVYKDVGSGAAYVFQDGTVTVGLWSKPSEKAPLTFTEEDGQPLKLDAGQTWITALAAHSDLSYN